jgi:hypothetical protein
MLCFCTVRTLGYLKLHLHVKLQLITTTLQSFILQANIVF